MFFLIKKVNLLLVLNNCVYLHVTHKAKKAVVKRTRLNIRRIGFEKVNNSSKLLPLPGTQLIK